MQKESWIYSMTAMMLGALGIVIRWLQCEIIFEEETGLPVKGAFISTLLMIFLAAAVIVLWLLSGRMSRFISLDEPEEALSGARETPLFIFTGLLAAVGSLAMFFGESGLMMRITALLGLLSAVILAMQMALTRWSGFGAFLSVIPVVFFGVWIVLFYKNNAVNPILWKYCMEILAILSCLNAAFRVCGYMFYRMEVRKTLFACGMALTLCLTVLTDDVPLSYRLIFAGWGVAFGALSWVIVYNLKPRKPETEEY